MHACVTGLPGRECAAPAAAASAYFGKHARAAFRKLNGWECWKKGRVYKLVLYSSMEGSGYLVREI